MKSTKGHDHLLPMAILLTLVLALGSPVSAGRTAAQSTARPVPRAGLRSTPPVPAEFQSLFTSLKANLDANGRHLDALLKASSKRTPVTFGTELLMANSNRGPALLRPQTPAAVTLELTRLHELGIQGVTIAIKYPLLTPSFPDYTSYLDFYKNVVAQVRQLGMKLDVESSILFANTPASPVTWDWSGLTFAKLESDLRQMDATIISQLKPDYLTIINEPDTMATLTGLKELNDPGNVLKLVKYILKDLNRGKTKIGAGSGAWLQASAQAFAPNFGALASIDYVDMHLYPYSPATLSIALAIADVARKHHKPIVVDETWLLKEIPDPTASSAMVSSDGAGYAQITARDVYSFWQPLDQEFLEQMVEFARVENVEYLSPFWSGYFFSYLEYGPTTQGLRYPQAMFLVNSQIITNRQADKFSPTGMFYKNLISSNSKSG